MGDWNFFSNHGHVLVCLAKNRKARLRDVALDVGITERAVQKIVRDFQDAGIVTVTKRGRCNRYRINRRKALRHNLVSHCTVGKLLALLAKSPSDERQEAAEEPVQPESATPEAKKAGGPVAAVKSPEPQPRLQAESKPHPEREPGSTPESESKSESESKRKPEPESEPDGAPIDTRQQGSLF